MNLTVELKDGIQLLKLDRSQQGSFAVGVVHNFLGCMRKSQQQQVEGGQTGMDRL